MQYKDKIYIQKIKTLSFKKPFPDDCKQSPAVVVVSVSRQFGFHTIAGVLVKRVLYFFLRYRTIFYTNYIFIFLEP